MRDSERGSGDIDAFSEPSRLELFPTPEDAGLGCLFDFCVSSNRSLTSFDDTTDESLPLCFWVCGFTMGD